VCHIPGRLKKKEGGVREEERGGRILGAGAAHNRTTVRGKSPKGNDGRTRTEKTPLIRELLKLYIQMGRKGVEEELSRRNEIEKMRAKGGGGRTSS